MATEEKILGLIWTPTELLWNHCLFSALLIELNVAKIALFHSMQLFLIHGRSEDQVAKAPPEEKSSARVCAEAGALSHLDSQHLAMLGS